MDIQQLLQQIEEYFPVLFSGVIGWVLLWFVASALYRKHKGKPILTPMPPDAQFVETWTSGHSNRSLLTKLGAARNCLLVAVTKTDLIVRPHFPFTLLFLPEVYDLDYVIPRTSIRTVKPKPRMLGESVEIEFTLKPGEMRSLELQLRQPEQFMQCLRVA